MKKINYRGKDYTNLAECCEALGISYQKAKRLCRHYVRAERDPAVAISWCLGSEKRSKDEKKTDKFFVDSEKGKQRMIKFQKRIAEELGKRKTL